MKLLIHNSSRTSVLTKLLIHLANFLTKLCIALKDCLYVSVYAYTQYIQVHEQFVSHRELLMNVHELGGNFFAKYHTCIPIEDLLQIIRLLRLIDHLQHHDKRWSSARAVILISLTNLFSTSANGRYIILPFLDLVMPKQ